MSPWCTWLCLPMDYLLLSHVLKSLLAWLLQLNWTGYFRENHMQGEHVGTDCSGHSNHSEHLDSKLKSKVPVEERTVVVWAFSICILSLFFFLSSWRKAATPPVDLLRDWRSSLPPLCEYLSKSMYLDTPQQRQWVRKQMQIYFQEVLLFKAWKKNMKKGNTTNHRCSTKISSRTSTGVGNDSLSIPTGQPDNIIWLKSGHEACQGRKFPWKIEQKTAR